MELTAAWTDTGGHLDDLVETDTSGNIKVFNSNGNLVTGQAPSGKYPIDLVTLHISKAKVDAQEVDLKPYVGAYNFTVSTTSTTNSAADAVSRIRVNTTEVYTNTLTQTITVNITADGKLWSAQSTSATDTEGEAANPSEGLDFTYYVSVNGQPSEAKGDAYGAEGANVDTSVTGTITVA